MMESSPVYSLRYRAPDARARSMASRGAVRRDSARSSGDNAEPGEPEGSWRLEITVQTYRSDHSVVVIERDPEITHVFTPTTASKT